MTDLIYTFNQRGHRFSEFNDVDMTNLKPLIDANPLMVTTVPSAARLWACSKCDASQYKLAFDHEAKTITAPTECPIPPEGITTRYTLEVPSGGMVVANDLRTLWGIDPHLDDHFASYNSHLGQHQTMLAYAELGMAYGPLGNSSPGLYGTPEGYEIASPEYDEETDLVISDGPPLAQIITDLWAFCIVDLDQFNQRGGDLTREHATVVDVDPGTYEFTHLTGVTGFDGWVNDRVVYTTIRKIEEVQ